MIEGLSIIAISLVILFSGMPLAFAFGVELINMRLRRRLGTNPPGEVRRKNAE